MNKSYLEAIICKQSDVTALSGGISAEIEDLKEKLHATSLENKLKLEPLITENEKLVKRAGSITKRVLTLKNEAVPSSEKLDECIQEIAETASCIERNEKVLCALNLIEDIYTNLNKAAANLKARLFYECSCCVKNAQEPVNGAKDISSLSIIKYLSQETSTLRERLIFEMTEVWSMAVRFSIDKASDEKNIRIDVNTSLLTDVKQIIRSFYQVNDTRILQKFFKKVEENLMLPIILHESAVSVEDMDTSAVLSVVVCESNKPSDYKEVFKNLLIVVRYLKAQLNVNIEGRGDLIQLMGSEMVKDITSSLARNCLSDMIPSHSGQSEGFSEIVANAENFQSELQKLNFFPPNHSPLFEGNEGTDLFFANKMYLSYLDRARTIAKGDLHSTEKSRVISSPDLSLIPTPVATEVKKIFNMSQNQAGMPTLLVSKSAEELLTLVDTILVELHRSDGDRALRLLFTIRNIFEIYSVVVPIHHRKLLGSLPQQVAVLHNNCLHLANRLLSLGCECRKWKAELKNHYHIYLDEAIALRKLAVAGLETCISNQRSLLIANLYDSGLANLREKAELGSDTERSFRQCIRQLQLLRGVWVEVLPDNVFANSMGFLTDEFTQAIVKITVEAEDISAQAANELIKILGIVEERLPKLFSEPKEVFRLCRKWDRFLNLIFILGSNLEKISERWASGLGPLAHAFTKTEAQSIVRALFRNTERRAAVLSQIYNS